MEIKVLDHGYVKLIDSMGTDETAIRAARMSTNKDFQGWDSDAKLLEFLWKHEHHTPFEMASLIIEVQAPIFVFREWQRHRTFSYNEMSARYTIMPDMHYKPDRHRFVKQHKSNKQMSGVELLPAEMISVMQYTFEADQKLTYQNYIDMTGNGLLREVARINTPVSRYSKMWAKANLRNWLHFLNLRLRPNAQYEIRVYAEAVAEIIKARYPRTYELFLEHTFHAVKFSRTEVEALKRVLERNLAGDPIAAALLAKLTS